LVAGLLLAPLLFSLPEGEQGSEIGPPRVLTGDETHYLLMVNSILSDHDLRLRNNYESVWNYGDDAGERWRGGALDPHIVWYEGEALVKWSERYRFEWHEASSHWIPVHVAGAEVPDDLPWYSQHPASFAAVLAVLSWPLASSEWHESFVLFINALFMVGAMLGFRHLALGFASSRRVAELVVLLTFLGTPLWHYSRALFSEGLMVCALSWAYALSLRRERALLAGVLTGLAISVKPVAALIALPLGIRWLWARDWRRAGLFAAVNGLAVACVLAYYAYAHGSPLRPPQAFAAGNVLTGLFGFATSRNASLLLYAPIIIIAATGWPVMLRRCGSDAAAVLTGFALYLIVIASWGDYAGGVCYGPRLLLPVIPLAMFGLLGLDHLLDESRFWNRGQLLVIGGLSILINAMGALPYWTYYEAHPLLGALP